MGAIPTDSIHGAQPMKTETTTVRFVDIENTSFKLVSHYSGTNTYTDVIKSVLLREIEKEP